MLSTWLNIHLSGFQKWTPPQEKALQWRQAALTNVGWPWGWAPLLQTPRKGSVSDSRCSHQSISSPVIRPRHQRRDALWLLSCFPHSTFHFRNPSPAGLWKDFFFFTHPATPFLLNCHMSFGIRQGIFRLMGILLKIFFIQFLSSTVSCVIPSISYLVLVKRCRHLTKAIWEC